MPEGASNALQVPNLLDISLSNQSTNLSLVSIFTTVIYSIVVTLCAYFIFILTYSLCSYKIFHMSNKAKLINKSVRFSQEELDFIRSRSSIELRSENSVIRTAVRRYMKLLETESALPPFIEKRAVETKA